MVPRTRARVLTRRDLNRALLARQLLLARVARSPSAVLEHLVGMQAQAPNLPYVGLWARLPRFHPDALSRLVMTRKAVRISLLRNTIHLVTARDAFRLKPLFIELGHRGFLHGSPWGRGMTRADVEPIAAAGREIMSERPRTVAELGRILAARFPGRDPQAMAYAVRSTVPLVFATPRGVWQARGPVALTTFEAWLGRPPGPSATPEELVLRYLGAFGPASPADLRAWSGLALRASFEALRPKLVTFRDAGGTELFDLPRAPRPDGDVDVPVRLIPDYDNILLGHADRSRIMPAGRHLGMFSSNGVMQGAVLVDGIVRAMWVPRQARGATTLEIAAFERPLGRSDRPAIEEEARSLLDLLAPGDRHEVRFVAVRA